MSATPLGSLAESIRQHPTTERALPLPREPPAPHGLAVCFLLTSLLTFTLVTPLKWRSQSGDLTFPCLPYSVLCMMPPARGEAITGASGVTRVGAPLCSQLSPHVLWVRGGQTSVSPVFSLTTASWWNTALLLWILPFSFRTPSAGPRLPLGHRVFLC